jgi:DNA-binding MarR family transcriptional regulator
MAYPGGMTTTTTTAGPDAVITDIEQALTRLIRRGNQPRVHERLAARAGVSLDRAAYAALSRVHEAGPLRLSELATRMGVDVSTASRQLQQLERSGLVARVGDPADRRASLLELSAEGRRVLARMRQARHAGLARVLAGWSARDRRRLATALTRLVDDLERVTGVRA